jgi:hypothetical protein
LPAALGYRPDSAISGLPVEGLAAFVIGMLGSSNVDIVGNTAADNTVFVGSRVLRGGPSTCSNEVKVTLGCSPSWQRENNERSAEQRRNSHEKEDRGALGSRDPALVDMELSSSSGGG